jgi:hypothetical protein
MEEYRLSVTDNIIKDFHLKTFNLNLWAVYFCNVLQQGAIVTITPCGRNPWNKEN